MLTNCEFCAKEAKCRCVRGRDVILNDKRVLSRLWACPDCINALCLTLASHYWRVRQHGGAEVGAYPTLQVAMEQAQRQAIKTGGSRVLWPDGHTRIAYTWDKDNGLSYVEF